MNAKNQTKGHICVITRNKRFFEHIVKTFKKADYEYVDVANTENCCDKKSGYNCDLKIIATVTPDSREHSGNIPIIVIGGSEDINSVVKSIKKGAFDFAESATGGSSTALVSRHSVLRSGSTTKDESSGILHGKMDARREPHGRTKGRKKKDETLNARFTGSRQRTTKFDEYTILTQTERIILHQIMKGKSNRQISDELHRSIRTIEDHRNHIMQKIKANNLVDLVKKCMDARAS